MSCSTPRRSPGFGRFGGFRTAADMWRRFRRVATGRGQYGPEVKALAIMLYYQCQSTVDRIVAFLNDMGLDISKRQVGRFLNEDTGVVVEEQQDVLRIGMETAAWINVDDTGARHRAANGYCTVIGNDLFTHFRSTGSKSRLDFLEHLCAGEESCTVNDAALDYMRRMKLSGKVISRLASHRQRRFADRSAWRAHLAALGIDRIKGFPDPVKIASEGALRGAISEAGRIAETVILSDDAGQFNVGDAHALCWVHAERLIRKNQASNEFRRARVDAALENVWGFYRDLSAYRQAPCSARREALSARFDEIFGRRTGYASLDKQLQRLKANKGELLRVLECPDTPLHTNGAERDIRAHVTRRKISFGTRSESGRAARGCLPRGVEDLQQARRVVPRLSAEPPWSCRRPRCAEARRSHHAPHRSLTLPAGTRSERIRKSLHGDSGNDTR